jgi:hypothetical protein
MTVRNGSKFEGVYFDEKTGRREALPGFQIRKIRRPTKQIPEWVEDPVQRNLVLESHPQFAVLGDLWAQVIQLYFIDQYGIPDVAERLFARENTVKCIIQRLRRRAKRLNSKEAVKAKEIERVAELRASGMSIREIASRVGFSKSKVGRMLRVPAKRPSINHLCGETPLGGSVFRLERFEGEDWFDRLGLTNVNASPEVTISPPTESTHA